MANDMNSTVRNDGGLERRVKAHKSMRTKFLVAFTAMFALVFFVAGLVSIRGLPFSSFDGWEGSARREAVRSLNLIANLKKEQLVLWFRERRGDVRVIAKNQIIMANLPNLLAAVRTLGPDDGNGNGPWRRIRDQDAFKRIAAFLSSVENADAQRRIVRYRRIHLADAATGLVVVSTDDAEIGAALDYGKILIQVVRNGKSYVGGVVSRDRNSVPHIDIAHPVMDRKGAVIGIIVLEIATEEVFGPLPHGGSGLGETGEALLIDEDGRILTSLRHPLPDGSLAEVLEYKITTKPAVFAASGREGTIESEDYRGRQVIAAYRHIRISPDWGWGMVVKIDKAQLLASMNDSIIFSIWIGISGILLVVALTLLLTRQLINPLRRMTEVAARLAAGDWSQRTRLKTDDEIGVLSSVFDIMAERINTTWKSLERRSAELAAVNNELESFAFAVAHDLRAPLRAIDGFSQALVEDYGESLDGDARTYLGYLREGSQEMGRLIDGLLTLSRVTRGEMSREDVDLSEIAAEIMENLKQTAPDRNVAINIAPDTVVNGDPRLLRVVLENLLGNAWKFTRDKADANIEFLTEDLNGKVRCTVCDNGVGFDMAYENKLFVPFQRLHGRREFEGTGIGLSTVQRIIERHGGNILAEGIVGEGATFTFELDAGRKDSG